MGVGEQTEVERFDVHGLRVNPCRGCFNCWFQTPGRCTQQDDAAGVMDTLDRADAVVLAAPLYFDGLPGPVKTLLDRMVCRVEPFFSVDAEGRSVHHPRRAGPAVTAVLISTCGFPEPEHFGPLKTHFQAICRNASWKEGGKLLVPGAGALDLTDSRRAVLELATLAGQEFAARGRINPDTERKMRGPWVEPELARRELNLAFRRMLGV